METHSAVCICLTSQWAAMTVQNVPQKQDKTQLHAAAAEI